MQNDTAKNIQVTSGGIPLLSMNERIMADLEETLRKGEKIELIPFKKWQAQRCEKFNCVKR